jgi:hypothetical protein
MQRQETTDHPLATQFPKGKYTPTDTSHGYPVLVIGWTHNGVVVQPSRGAGRGQRNKFHTYDPRRFRQIYRKAR